MADYAAEIRINTKIDNKEMKELEKSFGRVAERAVIAKNKVEALDKAGTPHNAAVYKEAAAELEKWNKELDRLGTNQKKVNQQPAVKTKGDFSSLSDTVEDYETRLKELRNQGLGVGDEIYDRLYIAWKNVVNAEKEYQANLNNQTEKGIADEAARLAKEKEKAALLQEKQAQKELELQEKISEQEERNRQKEVARIEREDAVHEKMEAEVAEAQRLNSIKEDAVISDHNIVSLLQEQERLQRRLSELKKAGVTAGYEEYDSIIERLGQISRETGTAESGFSKIARAAKKAFSTTGNVLKSVHNGFQKIFSIGKKVFSMFKREVKQTEGLFATLASRLKGITLSLLLFNWITRGFNAMVSGVKEGLQNMAKYSGEYNSAVSGLVSSLATLKNAFASAFAPILTVAIPYLTMLIDFLTAAVNKVAQLIAALTGKSTWIRAKKQTIDYAQGLDKVSGAAKKAYGSLAAFDELNVLNMNKNNLDEAGAGAINPGDMFEEVPIDSSIKKLADKLREIMSKLFEPLKKAWDRQGKKVIEAWKYALVEISKLAKSIGADFLEVWRDGVLSDFYTQVLLPLAKWKMEKGLPELLDIFTGFNQKVDWEGLRSRLSEFWKHLEKFGETIGEGLLIFIGELSDKLAKFLNSPAFGEFLDKVEEWMDNVKPEDVAKGLEAICKALIGYQAIKAFASVFTTIKNFLAIFGIGGAAADTAGTMTATAGAASGLATALGYLGAGAVGLGIFELIKEPIIRLGEAAGISAQQADYMVDRYKGFSGNLNLIKDPISIITNGVQGLGWEMSNSLGASAAFETAMEKIADGAIYTDEQLEKMRKNYGLTEEDTETLRQAMLEANPTLRDLADGFGLFDASVQTLDDISEGMELVKDKTFDSVGAFEQYAEKVGYTNEAIEFLKEQFSGGMGQSIEDFKEDISSAGRSIEDLKEDFTSAGCDMSAGLEQGFTEGSNSLSTSATTICNSLLDVVKKKLGIHSPSTIMAEIGRFLIGGLIQGITVMQDKLAQLLNNVCNNITEIFNKMKDFVFNVIKSISEKLPSIGKGVSNLWNGISGGSKVRSYVMAYTNPDMPELATGGITTGTTIAKIGEAGREAVLPLQNNTEWMDILAEKINGNGTITVVAEMDGDVVFQKTVQKNEIYMKQNGHSAYVY